jgi:hypothetical protein
MLFDGSRQRRACQRALLGRQEYRAWRQEQMWRAVRDEGWVGRGRLVGSLRAAGEAGTTIVWPPRCRFAGYGSRSGELAVLRDSLWEQSLAWRG